MTNRNLENAALIAELAAIPGALEAYARMSASEQAIAPLIHLYQDWQANNLNDDDYLSLPEYIAQHSDDEALAGAFEWLYAVYQEEVTGE